MSHLDSELKKLFEEAGVGETLQEFIARVESHEDRLVIARALHKKGGIDRPALQSALSPKASPGHRERIIARCRAIVEED